MSLGPLFTASGFFVVRTPLLPVEEYLAWAFAQPSAASRDAQDGLCAADTKADRQHLRETLGAIIQRPEVREALFIASPDLEASLSTWLAAPESRQGKRIERALISYFVRMTTRPTPFGLFAGCSIGRVADHSSLELPGRDRYVSLVRLDGAYLYDLVRAVSRSVSADPAVRYHPNPTLYKIGGEWRYIEEVSGANATSYRLARVKGPTRLDDLLAHARTGVAFSSLVDSLVSWRRGRTSREEAEAFVAALVYEQILLPDSMPAITGDDWTVQSIRHLARYPASQPLARTLSAVSSDLHRRIRSEPLSPSEYALLAEKLPSAPSRARPFRGDLSKPAAGISLGPAVVHAVEQAVATLRRVSVAPDDGLLASFRDRFSQRYDRRWVRLLEALDEDSGVPFEVGRTPGAEASPLIAGLPLTPARVQPRADWRPRDEFLLGKLNECLQRDETEIALSEADLTALEDREALPVPVAFDVRFALCATSEAALDAGDFRIVVLTSTGPSGARLLGRFCHVDPAIEQAVRSHLAEEQAALGGGVLAELVIASPEAPNVSARPVLRPYEIVCLGRSGASADKQMPLSDLLIGLVDGQFMLRDARSGARVVPRLTSAQIVDQRFPGVFRLMMALETQGSQPSLSWRWGALRKSPFLPRVTSGRTVLAPAQWTVRWDDFDGGLEPNMPHAAKLLEAWRGRRRLPLEVRIVHGDQELLIDFRNPLLSDVFLSRLQQDGELTLIELLPALDDNPVRGPEGRFCHEIVMPMLRTSAVATPESQVGRPWSGTQDAQRTFVPGSEWLFVKLYTGRYTADDVLREVVTPLIALAESEGVDRWFFVRYGDPDWHLRLRLHLRGRHRPPRILEALTALSAPFVGDGRIWRIALDTYEREVERWGGPTGIEAAESMFFHDSRAVLEMIPALGSAADDRWHVALLGVDHLLADFGVSIEHRPRLLQGVRTGFHKDFKADKALRIDLARRFREHRARLQLLVRDASAAHLPEAIWSALRRRSAALSPLIRRLKASAAKGRIGVTVEDAIANMVHLFVNRMTAAEAPTHEMVLADYLGSLYAEVSARETRPSPRWRIGQALRRRSGKVARAWRP